MAAPKPPMAFELTWSDDHRFDADFGLLKTTVDGAAVAGPSPMQSLALGLAGCLAADVIDILRKGRQPFRTLKLTFRGTRAEVTPRRLLQVSLRFALEGSLSQDVLDRAIALSRERYCSVWHSLREDIDLSITAEISP